MMFLESRSIMANWPDLMFRARVFAANEPGFLANTFLELVALNGGPLGYSLNTGVNLATPEGRSTADFHAALALFCYQLRDLGVGHLPFNPAPHHPGPLVAGLGGPADPVPGGPAVPNDDHVDHDFVQVLGGIHPIFGAWVEPEEEEVVVVGGIHPIHGPWIEGEQLPPGGVDIDNLIDGLLEDLFGQENVGDQEPVNEEQEDNLPDD
jgi:hypothetical protein